MFENIQNIICDQLGLSADKVTPDARFVEDLFCDSLDIVELLSTAEEQFDMPEIPEDKLAEIKTVGDLVAYFESTVKEG